ncbi:hypothetical protein CGRA01v4_11242 [Colletotrichum graminicola]|nr:hypothetical protein CGRA01v4_11242 [Colletotrichum graminicola]
MRLLTRCRYVRTAELSGGAQRGGDRKLHDVSQLRAPEPTSWGSFAGKPITRRPTASTTAGARRAVNRKRGSTSPTETTCTPRPSPKIPGDGKWVPFFRQQIQGRALDPKVRQIMRQREVKARPGLAPAPRWGLDQIPREERAGKWGVAYLSQTGEPSMDLHLGKPASLRSRSLSNENPSRKTKSPLIEATAPLKRSEPPQAPRYEKWGTLHRQQRGSAKEDGEKPEASEGPRQYKSEKMERHFRRIKSRAIGKFRDEQPSGDHSRWAPTDYVYDEPFWMQLLLKTVDTWSSKPGVCYLCAQHTTGITGHHAVPQAVSRNFPGRFTRRQMTTRLWLCQPCHVVVHYVFRNEQLAMKYNSIDRIASDPRIRSWLFFAKHHSVDDARQLMLTKPEVVHEPLAFQELRELVSAAETVLERLWTQHSSHNRLKVAGHPSALKLAVRRHGAPQRVLLKHIQLAMKKRPEWAGWYYHVFEMGRRRREMEVVYLKSVLPKHGLWIPHPTRSKARS